MTAGKQLLLVDDDTNILMVIRRQMEEEGYTTILEHTGSGGIERAKNPSISAVLLDLGLVDMDGFEVLAKIRAARPELPVIIVTGCHEESEGRRAFEMGAWDYVTKPIDFQYLKNILALP
jgi:DNA-binding response OmpR family regulator